MVDCVAWPNWRMLDWRHFSSTMVFRKAFEETLLLCENNECGNGVWFGGCGDEKVQRTMLKQRVTKEVLTI